MYVLCKYSNPILQLLGCTKEDLLFALTNKSIMAEGTKVRRVYV